MSEYEGKHDVTDGELPPMPHDHVHHERPKPSEVSLGDKAWRIARRVGKGAFWGGISTFATTRDLTLTAIGATIGGIGAGSEKLIKETRKAKGKPSWQIVVKKWLEAIGITLEFLKD